VALVNAAEGVADGDGHLGPCARRADGAGDAEGGVRPRGAATAAACRRFAMIRLLCVAAERRADARVQDGQVHESAQGDAAAQALEDPQGLAVPRGVRGLVLDAEVRTPPVAAEWTAPVCARAYRGACVRAPRATCSVPKVTYCGTSAMRGRVARVPWGPRRPFILPTPPWALPRRSLYESDSDGFRRLLCRYTLQLLKLLMISVCLAHVISCFWAFVGSVRVSAVLQL
jgi:hypothetical protein